MNLGNKLFAGLSAGACALVLAALLLPAVAVAGGHGCPKGQTGTPPYCTKPSNNFQLQTVKHEGTRAKIRIKVPGPGVVKATGKYLVPATAKPKAKGRFWMTLKLTSAGVAILNKKRTLKVRIAFVYTPTEGTPRTRHKTIRFKAKK